MNEILQLHITNIWGCVLVCVPPPLPAVADLDLVRGSPRLEEEEWADQVPVVYGADPYSPIHGRLLPDLPLQQDRTAVTQSIHEVPVSQHLLWGFPYPACLVFHEYQQSQ